MRTNVIQSDRVDAPTSEPVTSDIHLPRRNRRMSGGRIAVLVLGIVVAVLGLAALAGGAALVIGNETQRDSAGFFSTERESFATDSHAIVSENLDVGTDGPN
jgi:hypothetical protein